MIYDICLSENGSGKFINGIECGVYLIRHFSTTHLAPSYCVDDVHRDDYGTTEENRPKIC